MPWTVRREGDQHCVVKKSDGKKVGCHDTHEAAMAQVRALYASESDMTSLIQTSVEAARERDVNTPGGGHDLRNYWVKGPGAVEIGWGIDGSFARCVAKLGKHVKNPQGLCAEYHKAATGEWPAEKGVESTVSGIQEFHGNHNQKDHNPHKDDVDFDRREFIDLRIAIANGTATAAERLRYRQLSEEAIKRANGKPNLREKVSELREKITGGPLTKAEKKAMGALEEKLFNDADLTPAEHAEYRRLYAKRENNRKFSLNEFHGTHNQGDHNPHKDEVGGPTRQQDRRSREGFDDDDDDDDFTFTLKNKKQKTGKMQAYADEPWEGVLVVEGTESGDGRLFALGSLDWAQLPLPLMYQPVNVGGHNESFMVGQIEHAARSGNVVKGWGKVFGQALAGEHGDTIRIMMGPNGPGGVSVDVDKVKDADVEMIYAENSGAGAFGAPETTIFHRGRIRGATLVAFPAFVEAKLTFTENVVTASASADDEKPCSCGDPLIAAVHTITIPDLPPASWFNEPTDVELNGALTITDEGRVYGILAPANTTHRSVKTKVPRGNVDYTRFHKGETIVEGGGRVVTGVITADCGHAPTSNYGTLQNRIDHYDNSCSVLANIRIGESRNGYVWAAGALNAGADPRQVARALGCALSGDWQPHPDRPGIREFISAHLVPVPGFPMARTQASVQYNDGVIAASAVPVQHVPVAVARRVDPGIVAVRLAKEQLARQLGLDAKTRKQRLLETVGR
jgi:hypothetical protein